MTVPELTIDLPVRGEWPNVERIRSSFGDCVMAVSGNSQIGDAVALVTAELSENAIKYGHWEGGETTFRVRLWSDDGVAHVSVESPIAPGAGCPVELDEALAWIARFPSAAEAYQAKIVAVAAAGPSPAKSGLGLVRLAYEASCRLRAEVTGDRLRITADFPRDLLV